MCPPPRAFMIGRAAWVAYIRPRTLTCIMRRQSSVSASRMGPSSITPALLTRMSRPPQLGVGADDHVPRLVLLARRRRRSGTPAPPLSVMRAGQRLQPVRAPRGDGDPRALRRQRERRRLADARRGARHDRHLPVQSSCHSVLSFSVSCSVVLCAHGGAVSNPGGRGYTPSGRLPQMGAGMSTQERTKRDGRDAPSQEGQGDGSGPALDKQQKGQVEERLRASALVVHEVIRRAGEEDLGRPPRRAGLVGAGGGAVHGLLAGGGGPAARRRCRTRPGVRWSPNSATASGS